MANAIDIPRIYSSSEFKAKSTKRILKYYRKEKTLYKKFGENMDRKLSIAQLRNEMSKRGCDSELEDEFVPDDSCKKAYPDFPWLSKEALEAIKSFCKEWEKPEKWTQLDKEIKAEHAAFLGVKELPLLEPQPNDLNELEPSSNRIKKCKNKKRNKCETEPKPKVEPTVLEVKKLPLPEPQPNDLNELKPGSNRLKKRKNKKRNKSENKLHEEIIAKQTDFTGVKDLPLLDLQPNDLNELEPSSNPLKKRKNKKRKKSENQPEAKRAKVELVTIPNKLQKRTRNKKTLQTANLRELYNKDQLPSDSE